MDARSSTIPPTQADRVSAWSPEAVLVATVSFSLVADPAGWSRARVNARGGKVRHFKAPKLEAYQERIANVAKRAMRGGKPIDGALHIRVEFWMAMPPSWSAKKKGTMRGQPHAQKPDADNLVKAVCDACNKIVWADDAQIAFIDVRKVWESVGVVMVTVESL